MAVRTRGRDRVGIGAIPVQRSVKFFEDPPSCLRMGREGYLDIVMARGRRMRTHAQDASVLGGFVEDTCDFHGLKTDLAWMSCH